MGLTRHQPPLRRTNAARIGTSRKCQRPEANGAIQTAWFATSRKPATISRQILMHSPTKWNRTLNDIATFGATKR